MYHVKGQVINCFDVPASEKYPASFKVQLLGDSITKDGQVKKEMVTLSVPMAVYSRFVARVGEVASVPIGLFVSQGRLQSFYAGGQAEPLSSGESAAMGVS